MILISDFQTVEWRPTHSERRAAIEESIQRLANAARVVCVPVRLTAGFNLAIESIEIEPQFVCAGDLVTVTATVRNHDRDSARGEFLEFLLDNRRVDSTALSIPPGHSKRFAFRLTPTEPGPHSISIHLSDDALPVDNVRWRALNVHEHIDALVVGDRLARASDVGASGFVRLSLAPETSGNPQTKRLAVTSADIQDLGSLDLQPFECVFVCGVEAFADREIAVLESWVRSGGTIVFAPTGATNSRAWNEKLGAARRGLLPVQLGGRVGSATRPDAVFRFDTRNLEHSLFRVYANDQARRGLHNVLTFEYFRLLPEQDRNVEIPLRFENQDPAIAMGRYGDGTCVVLATAADEKRWSTWHLAGGHFLVIVNELAHHAAEHREPSAERIVGERIEYRESSGGKAEHAVLRDPHGRIVPLFLESSNEHDIVRSAGLTAPGIYRFRSGRDEPEQLFAVNPDTKQSDPASPDRVALETVFGPGVEVVRSQPESALNSVRKPIDPGHEPKLVVLLATIALVLLMIEQWTAFTKHSNLHAAPTETSSQTSRESM